MTIFYSGITGGFYDSNVHNTVPEDAVEVTSEERQVLLIGTSKGQIIRMSDGKPVLQDLPPPTRDELAIIERGWRDGELRKADIEVFKAEDAIGAFNAESWRSYRLLLRAWPESVDFPDSAKRPVAPDEV